MCIRDSAKISSQRVQGFLPKLETESPPVLQWNNVPLLTKLRPSVPGSSSPRAAGIRQLENQIEQQQAEIQKRELEQQQLRQNAQAWSHPNQRQGQHDALERKICQFQTKQQQVDAARQLAAKCSKRQRKELRAAQQQRCSEAKALLAPQISAWLSPPQRPPHPARGEEVRMTHLKTAEWLLEVAESHRAAGLARMRQCEHLSLIHI
eukprot:TRINITY_DN33438_c0_g1_i1.p1 TRINITY_DN33438_c0_g1~~TRINITY_DN33438_c0_g1_i1.p1  ORF type:complete len:207 (-),score=49.74 TRINITY_DN33438_c0_g1_i1:38-658(-)